VLDPAGLPCPSVEVTFTKVAGRRYTMTVAREHGPELAPRQGPGYHDYLPHDAVHFIVESVAGLSGGVFGRIAAGHSNLFTPADPALRRHQARREAKRKLPASARLDMARSESLASLCLPLWELRAGHRRELPPWLAEVEPSALASSLVERILERLDAFAAEWRRLQIGASMTLCWPGDVSARRRQTAALDDSSLYLGAKFVKR
jgi:hypothetical protein